MRVLGLDIATTTGFNVIVDGKLVKYGTIDLDPKADHLARYKQFKKEITRLLKEYKPNILAVEGVYHGKNAAATAYLNILRGIVFGLVPDRCTIRSATVASIRMQVLGKGKKHDKNDVFNWVVSAYSLKDFNFKKDHDITDSILISHWAQSLDTVKD